MHWRITGDVTYYRMPVCCSSFNPNHDIVEEGWGIIPTYADRIKIPSFIYYSR